MENNEHSKHCDIVACGLVRHPWLDGNRNYNTEEIYASISSYKAYLYSRDEFKRAFGDKSMKTCLTKNFGLEMRRDKSDQCICSGMLQGNVIKAPMGTDFASYLYSMTGKCCFKPSN